MKQKPKKKIIKTLYASEGKFILCSKFLFIFTLIPGKIPTKQDIRTDKAVL